MVSTFSPRAMPATPDRTPRVFLLHPKLTGTNRVCRLARELHDIGRWPHIDDLAPEDIGRALYLIALSAFSTHLDQQHVTLNVRPLSKIDDLNHINNLVEMLRNLFNLEVIARCVMLVGTMVVRRWCDVQALDVVATLREQTDNARQCSRLVLHQYGKYASHNQVLSVFLAILSWHR